MKILLLFVSFTFVISNLNICSIRDSCSNSSHSSPSIYNDEIFIQTRNCFCDQFCHQYGDCCNSSLNSHLNFYECTDFLSPIMINHTSNFHSLSIWMRNKCLINYQGSPLDNQCRNIHQETFHINPSLFIPVTSLQTNITYRNYFCAFCNNEPNDQLIFWQLKIFCRNNNDNQYNQLIFNDNQQMKYYIQNLTKYCLKIIYYPHKQGHHHQPSVFIRPCKKILPQICPLDTSIDLSRNCSLSNPKYRYNLLTKHIYHNPYCAQCQNQNNHSISCMDPIQSSAIPTMNHIRVNPLSILFNPKYLQEYFISNNSIEFIYSLTYKCRKSNEFYDLFRKKCSLIKYSNKTIMISMYCQSPIRIWDKYIHYSNGSLYLINQLILLEKDQFIFIENKQILFCADQFKSIIIHSYYISFYRNIFSIITTFISLIFHFIFIIIFYLIPSLHNLPGKYLLSLSISLFFGQFIFILISNFHQDILFCFLSAIFLHYFYLSSFFWLLIISIEIHSRFTHQTIEYNQIVNSNRFRFYLSHLFVFLSTSFIILIAYLIQLIYPQSNYSPAYGYLFCSISKSYAMIIFFLLPIGLSLIIIFILFIKTILAISHTQQISQFVNKNNNNDYHMIFIYVRLGCLMGFQWILLILALIIQQKWSWIIFEIINSLSGIFICLGFLYSKRIWNEIKENISKRLIHRRTSLKNSTISMNLISPIKQL